MKEAVNMSETSVPFYQTTRRNEPQYGRLHTGRRWIWNLNIFHLNIFPEILININWVY
jgi:hypothetical protein